MKPLVPALTLCAAALGCTSSIPLPEAPLAPPEAFVSVTADAEIWRPQEAWWRELGGDALDELVAEALENNATLERTRANAEAALARARMAGADRRPQTDLSLTSARRKQNFIGFPIPGSEGNVLSTTSSNAGLSFNVSWEADLWGRLAAREAAALADLAASQELLEAARQSIVGQTVKTWLAIAEADAQLELARETLESRRDSERRIANRYQRGINTALDVRLARAQVHSVEAVVLQRETQLDTLKRILETLLGRYPRGAIAPSRLPELGAPLSPSLPSEVVAMRPDLRAAEKRALRASAELRAAQRALYPSFRITTGGGTSAGELGDLIDGDFSVWSLAASLLQPVFQGGRLRANVDLAEAGLAAEVADWLQATLDAFREIETTLQAERSLRAQLAALTEAEVESRAAETLASDRYNAGLADYLAVLESQRASFQSSSARLAVERQRLDARVDLFLALGVAGKAPVDPTSIDHE